MTDSVFVMVGREDVAEDLWAYGEDDLAVRALDLGDPELGRVGVLAGRLLVDPAYATPSGAGMLVAKACALAAVEVLEGERRPLKRKRRRSVPAPPAPAPAVPPPGEDNARNVFLAACAELAARFEPLGFRFAKSGPHMSRRSGEFSFTVHFITSHLNVAGEYVALQLSAVVRSTRLRRWREANQVNEDAPHDGVAGGPIRNLGVEMRDDEWDVADPADRPAMLNRAAEAIEQVALPYFALFEDPDALVERLRSAPVASFDALPTIEWLLSHGERDAAVAHAQLLLEDDRLRRQTARARQQMESGELRVLPYSLTNSTGLAYAALVYGIDP